jgi:CDP-paratose 2-epimerase
MRVLVTGGCGFLGSHICEYYRKKGAEAVAFDNMTKHELMRTGFKVSDSRMHNWDFLKGIGTRMVKGDVRDLDGLLKASEGCDFIIHTAAQPAMTISIEQPDLDFTSNVIGTFNVLEAARKHDIPVVNSSSIHVYGNKINDSLKEGKTRYTLKPPAIDEDYPIMRGQITPLHASKRSAEIYVETFADTYGLKSATFRLTGMYGPRQFGGEDHGWVANFVIRTVLGMPITVFGTGKQVRDILYASDAASSFDAFYRHPVPGIYNVGGGVERMISLVECLELIRELTGLEQKIEFKEVRPGDLWYFICDITKARKNLKWEPKVSNEEGVKKLVDWVTENKRMFGG